MSGSVGVMRLWWWPEPQERSNFSKSSFSSVGKTAASSTRVTFFFQDTFWSHFFQQKIEINEEQNGQGEGSVPSPARQLLCFTYKVFFLAWPHWSTIDFR